MARQSRIELPGGMHHVTAKSPTGLLLFYDDHDRHRYLQLLAREVAQRQWRVLTYCLLSNHLHILLQTPEPNLGAGLKRVHEDFATCMNQRHHRSGHLFGSRFYSGLVQSDRHIVGCLRYIARNPVEAGVCRQARAWPWSAHRALAGLSDPPSFLDTAAAYSYLASDEGAARLAYVQLVAHSNAAVLAGMQRDESDQWMLTAIDDLFIPIAEIAAFIEIGLSTAYRRVAAARENEGSVP